jgi:hypothetical protein
MEKPKTQLNYLALSKAMYLLDTSRNTLLGVFKAERRLPFGTGLNLNSPKLLMLLLKFHHQKDGVFEHVLL